MFDRAGARGTIAGIIAGLALLGLLAVVSRVRSTPVTAPPDASAEFVAAWERSKRGTYVVESTFERESKDGEKLLAGRIEVRRPPDHLVLEFGGITGAVGGKTVICGTDPSKPGTCSATGVTPPAYDSEVAEEIANLRSYFSRTPPLYTARSSGDGCFDLEADAPAIEYPYGKQAQFCFDAPTGAMTKVERHLDNDLVERVQATSIRTDVVGTDFDLEPNPATLPVPVTRPRGSAAPGTVSATPTTPRGPLAGLTDDELFAAMTRTSGGSEETNLIDEAYARLEARRIGINDTRWRGPDGTPIRPAYPLIRRMIEAGYYLPPP